LDEATRSTQATLQTNQLPSSSILSAPRAGGDINVKPMLTSNRLLESSFEMLAPLFKAIDAQLI